MSNPSIYSAWYGLQYIRDELPLCAVTPHIISNDEGDRATGVQQVVHATVYIAKITTYS